MNTRIGLNEEDVITEIKLHHNIINSNKLNIHPCKCIIPKSTAKWNLKKGRSNAITKALELFPVNLHVNSDQSEAIARDKMI